MQLLEAVEQSFEKYAGETIYNRALVDVRDGLKPSARLGLYAQFIDKITHDKPYQKSTKSVASAMSHFYTHGDVSMYDLLMRMGKFFVCRYPLEDIQGSIGNLIETNNHAANRYTEMRLSKLGTLLFDKIKEETIDRWYLNYSGDEYFPEVLPSLGFWGICNGSMGIATGLSSSIPQFNLREMNDALISLLRGEEPTIPAPDFATGGLLLNTNDVIEALKVGQGVSCRLRAKMDYDEKTRTITVVEIPYSTYTNTICQELEELLDDKTNGIETFIDVTGVTPNIQIKLSKNANPSEVIELLYKNTSLQNTYGINLTMLDKGRYPKVFGIVEAMQAHLEHEKAVYRRSFEFQLAEIIKRLHLLEGYILACAHIEEIVQLIKNSQSRREALVKLTQNFELDEIQADAILKLTLSRIAALEVQKFIKEKEEKLEEKIRIEEILNDEKLLIPFIIERLQYVSSTFGDKRKTELLNIEDGKKERLYYFSSDGRMGLSSPKDSVAVGILPEGLSYLAVTQKGIVYRVTEQPKRMKRVINLEEGDVVLKVFPDYENYFITYLDQNKRFRCKAVVTLNKTKTTLGLTNLKEVYFTKNRTTKTDYKKQILET